MLKWVGVSSGRRAVMGFVTASALVSMWISSAATTLMLLTAVLAVLDGVEDKAKPSPPLLQDIAYAASIGGLGTPIGTPTMLAVMQVYEQTTGRSIHFARWMSWGVPVVVLKVRANALIMTRNLRGTMAVQ